MHINDLILHPSFAYVERLSSVGRSILLQTLKAIDNPVTDIPKHTLEVLCEDIYGGHITDAAIFHNDISSLLTFIQPRGNDITSILKVKGITPDPLRESLSSLAARSSTRSPTDLLATITVHSEHHFGTNSRLLRSIPRTKVRWIQHTQPLKEFDPPLGQTVVNTVIYTGIDHIMPYTGHSALGAPSDITNFLGVALGSTNTKSTQARIKFAYDQASIDPTCAFARGDVAKAVNNLGIPIGASLISPISFVTEYQVKALKDTGLFDEGNTLWVLVVHKIKGTFAKKLITFSEYFTNPQKYIASIAVPKVITTITPGYCGTAPSHIVGNYATQVVRDIPTLLIPSWLQREKTGTLLVQLLDAINNKDLSYLVNRQQREEFKAKLPEITRYWNGFLDIVSVGKVNIAEAIAWAESVKNNADDIKTAAENAELLLHLGPTLRTPEYRTLKNNTAELAKKGQKVASIAEQHNNTIREQNSLLSQQRSYEAELRKLIRLTEDTKKAIAAQIIQRQELEKQVRELAQQHSELARTFVTNVHAEPDKNLPLLHIIKVIVVDKNHNAYPLEFQDEEDPRVAEGYDSYMPSPVIETRKALRDQNMSASEKVKILALLLANDAYTLNSVTFLTLEPIRIYVDACEKPREQCDVVVGGPYEITVFIDRSRLGSPQAIVGRLKLVGQAGVFGYKIINEQTIIAKQHPHSKESNVMRNSCTAFANFLRNYTTICWGDAIGDLVNAFQTNDIEVIRRITEAWVSTAWTKDEWGKNWTWFPNVNAINWAPPVPIPQPIPELDSVEESDGKTEIPEAITEDDKEGQDA